MESVTLRCNWDTKSWLFKKDLKSFPDLIMNISQYLERVNLMRFNLFWLILTVAPRPLRFFWEQRWVLGASSPHLIRCRSRPLGSGPPWWRPLRRRVCGCPLTPARRWIPLSCRIRRSMAPHERPHHGAGVAGLRVSVAGDADAAGRVVASTSSWTAWPLWHIYEAAATCLIESVPRMPIHFVNSNHHWANI